MSEAPATLSRVIEALTYGLNRLPPDFNYRVVGTAAALLQGVPIRADDIDVLVRTRADVDRFAVALADAPCPDRPTWLSEARQYFARFLINGIELEVSTVEIPDAGEAECTGSGPWRNYNLVQVGEHAIPAVALELRLVTELVRDRPDRSDPLIEHLRAHGYDDALLDRSMNHRGVRSEVQERVRARLGSSVG